MKTRAPFFIAIGLLILIASITWFTFLTPNQEPAQVFSATINRDCAPWDGAAFIASIPYEASSFINISIWQSPDIKLPATFAFPDETVTIGNAAFLLQDSEPAPLTGTVFFWRVEQGSPVEGRFDLVTEAGQRLKGRFRAEWGNEVVYCG